MSVLETAIGWLAPAQCVGCEEEGSSLCPECLPKLAVFGQRCWRCNQLSPGSRTCQTCRHTGSPSRVYICTDHDGLARDLISAYKFGHQRSVAPLIARLMAQSIPATSDQPRDYLVVPIPTATQRVRQRGFDHTALLAKYLAYELKAPAANHLRRLGQSRQLGARREDRLKQLQSSFSVRDKRLVAGRNILLVDDVVTTGGTIIAAAQALRQAGAARVDAALFAKRL